MTTSSVQYASSIVSVSNAQAGQKISVTLGNPSQTCWSSGAAFTTSSVSLSTSTGSPVPVSSCKIAGNLLEIITASSGSSSGSLSFNIVLSVAAAAGTQTIQLTNSSTPGPVVTFAFAGNKAVTLSQYAINLAWPA